LASEHGISLPRNLLDAVTAIVSQAAATIMDARKGALVPRIKADQSPVTAADVDAERIILEGLTRLLPGTPVVSEEATARMEPVSVAGEFALVDPIDGTRELLAGRYEFVNVALAQAGRPVLGVVAAPALGRIWRAADGHGAETMLLAPGAAPADARDRKPIRCRAWQDADPVAAVSRSHLDPQTEAFLARFPRMRRVPSGSAMKLCLLAEGAADIYPRLGGTHEWDIAAGHAVLAAAGGIVTAATGGALTYGNRPDGFAVPGFIAWGDPAAAARLGPPNRPLRAPA
jgi:3'(2'), 5'-bisphosphate nucleotidase